MSSSTRLTAFIIIGLVIGAAVGYLAAGPISYNSQIDSLTKQLADAQKTSPADLQKAQADLAKARANLTKAQTDLATSQTQIKMLQDQISALQNPVLSGSLSIAGSTTIQPISQQAANQFMTLHPNVQVSVAGGGSGAGIKAAGTGTADIGESSRNILPAEYLLYPTLNLFPIAKDSVAIVVNPSLSNVTDLTFQQTAQIYAGQITNWKQVGGPDHSIDLYTREAGSGTLDAFNTFWMTPLSLQIAGTASVKPSNGEMKTAVASDPYGIAYISLGFVDSSIRALKLGGVEPTIANVNSGTYTPQRVLFVFTKGSPSPLAKVFIDFLQSSQGQQIVQQNGYMPIYS